MNKYIFVTDEGFTETPNGEHIENIQVLGFSSGETLALAQNKLLSENHWIIDSNYSVSEIRGIELMQ